MQKPEDLWNKFQDQDSEEDLVYVFDNILRKIMNESNLYYIKHLNKTVIVIQRTDNKVIYETGDPAEIEILLKVGVEK